MILRISKTGKARGILWAFTISEGGMVNGEFVAFIKVNADDSSGLMASKSQYIGCASRLVPAIMRGRDDRRRELLNDLSFLKDQTEACKALE